MNGSTSSDDDVWCERRMWAAVGVDTPEIGFAEPFACVTGLVMCCAAVWPLRAGECVCVPRRVQLPHSLTVFRAALFLLGVGTACFHTTTRRGAMQLHLNPALFDFFPLVMVAMHLMLLYVRQWAVLMGVVMVWGCAVVVAMDSGTYAYWDADLAPDDETAATNGQGTYGAVVNAVFLIPLAVTLVYATVWVFSTAFSRRVWGLIAFGTLLWLLDAYLCTRWLPLALGHGLYHMIMAYVFLITACYAMPPERWALSFDASWGFWPQLTCARCMPRPAAVYECLLVEIDRPAHHHHHRHHHRRIFPWP